MSYDEALKIFLEAKPEYKPKLDTVIAIERVIYIMAYILDGGYEHSNCRKLISAIDDLKDKANDLDNHIDMVEATEPEYMEHGPNAWDRARIESGRKPFWAKSMKEIGPRSRMHGSSSATEVAMRRVTDPEGLKEPTKASTVIDANKGSEMMNQRIADEIKRFLDDYDSVEANKEYVSVFKTADDGQLDEFRIIPHGASYGIKFVGHKSVFDRDFAKAENLHDVADYINSK